jgi:hypothetical protein
MLVQGLKIGYCDKHGNMVIPMKYDFTIDLLKDGNFINGYAKVQLNKKRGFIDTAGNLVIPCRYEDALYFSEGLAPVLENKKKWGYINEKGKLVIPCKYNMAYPFSDSLAKVKTDDNFGYINLSGKTVIDEQYEAANNFSNNIASVKLNGKFGLIDTAGVFIVPCTWTDLKIMPHGLLKVTIGDKMAYYSLKTRKYLWAEEGFQ